MPLELTLITWLKNRYISHQHTSGEGATVAHSALSGLTTGDDHTQYRLESEDHTHRSSGLQGGLLSAVLDNIVTFEDTVVVFEGKIVYT